MPELDDNPEAVARRDDKRETIPTPSRTPRRSLNSHCDTGSKIPIPVHERTATVECVEGSGLNSDARLELVAMGWEGRMYA